MSISEEPKIGPKKEVKVIERIPMDPEEEKEYEELRRARKLNRLINKRIKENAFDGVRRMTVVNE